MGGELDVIIRWYAVSGSELQSRPEAQRREQQGGTEEEAQAQDEDEDEDRKYQTKRDAQYPQITFFLPFRAVFDFYVGTNFNSGRPARLM